MKSGQLAIATRAAQVLAVLLALAMAGIGARAVPAAPSGIGVGAEAVSSAPSGAPAGEARLEIIGQVGGFPADVAVRGDLAYLGVGMQVLALDFSDVTDPKVVAQSGPLGGDVSYVRTAGERVVVVSAWRGDESWRLTVLGLPSGDTLPTLGQVAIGAGGEICEVVADGPRVVLRGDGGLTFVDVAEPADLRPQALPVPLPPVATGITGVVFVDHLLYVFMSPTDQPSGLLRVLDLADPLQPRIVGEASIGGRLPTVGGDTLLAMGPAASPSGLGLQVIDVADPHSPRLQSSTPITDDIAYVTSVVPIDDGAVVVGYFGERLVYDLADRSNPRRVATVLTPDSIVHAAKGDGDRLYVIGDVAIPGRMTLAALNAADRTYLPTLGNYLVPPLQVAGLSIAGSSLYVTGRQPVQGDRGALWSVDMSDPARPVARSSMALPVHHSKLAREGPYLYASGEGTGLHVVEATAEGGLRERGVAPGGADSTEVAVGNGVAYVGDAYRTELVAIDVSNPDAPKALPPTGVVDRFLALRLRGDFLYGAAIDSGFVTLDVRQPGQPRLARRDLRAQGSPYWNAVDADGSIAVVAGSSLRVLDVSSVSGTRQVGAINEGGDSVALAGKLAFVVSNYVVAAVDLSQPEAPNLLATLPLPYEPRLGSSGRSDIAVLGDVVAVATGQGVGVLLIRFTPAVAPEPSPTPEPPPTLGAHRAHLPLVLRAGNPTQRTGQLNPVSVWPADVRAVAVDGDTVFALRPAGPGSEFRMTLTALDYSNPEVPIRIGTSEAFDVGDLGMDGPAVAVGNGYAYVPAGFNGGLVVVDIRDVRRPWVVARLFKDGDWRGLTVSGTRGYLFGHQGNVHVLDLTDPAAPRDVGVMRYPAGGDGQHIVTAVAVNGWKALVGYLSDGGRQPGLAAWDVTNPVQPQLLALALPGIGVAGIAMDGQLAYVSPAQDQPVSNPLAPGVLVMDVSDVTRMREVGYWLDAGLPEMRWLTLLDPRTLVAGGIDPENGPEGVYVWDVTDVSMPRVLDRFDAAAIGLAAAGGRVVAAVTHNASAGWPVGGVVALDWVSRP